MVSLQIEIDKYDLDMNKIKNVCGFWKNVQKIYKMSKISKNDKNKANVLLCGLIKQYTHYIFWWWLPFLLHSVSQLLVDLVVEDQL